MWTLIFFILIFNEIYFNASVRSELPKYVTFINEDNTICFFVVDSSRCVNIGMIHRNEMNYTKSLRLTS